MTLITSVGVILSFSVVLVVGVLSVLRDLSTRGPFWPPAPNDRNAERVGLRTKRGSTHRRHTLKVAPLSKKRRMLMTIHPVHFTVKNSGERCRAEVNRDAVDRVEWIEEAAHPLAGCIRSRSSFLAHTHKTLGLSVPRGTRLVVETVRVESNYAVVTLRFQAIANTELALNYRYRWICRFTGTPLQGSRA
jgi:hypothetical protein